MLLPSLTAVMVVFVQSTTRLLLLSGEFVLQDAIKCFIVMLF